MHKPEARVNYYTDSISEELKRVRSHQDCPEACLLVSAACSLVKRSHAA